MRGIVWSIFTIRFASLGKSSYWDEIQYLANISTCILLAKKKHEKLVKYVLNLFIELFNCFICSSTKKSTKFWLEPKGNIHLYTLHIFTVIALTRSRQTGIERDDYLSPFLKRVFDYEPSHFLWKKGKPRMKALET